MRCLALVIALVVGLPAAMAQEQAEQSAQRGRGAERGALSPADVASRAQQVITGLYRLRARVHHVSDLEHHLATIDDLGRRVERLKVDSDLGTLDVQPRRELQNLKEHWTELDARVAETAQALEESSSKLEEQAEGLRTERLRWERTRDAAEGYPAAARQAIDEVLSALQEVEGEVDATLGRVLGAQTRLAAHAIASGDVLTQLEHALDESRARIFSPTHPPGFGGMTGRRHESLGEQLHAAWIHHVHSVDRFATTAGGRIYLHALLVFLILAFLYWLRRESRLPEKDDSPASRALHHPLAVTALLGLMMVRPLYPLTPRAVVELSQLLAVIPLLRVRTSPKVRRMTSLIVALYLLEWVRLLLDEHDTEHRLALQMTAVGATIAFAWCAFHARGMARPGWGLASLVSLVGLGACVGGYVPLAVLVIEGTVASAFVAVVLMAVHWMITGLVDAALTTPAAQSTILGRHAAITRRALTRLSLLVLGVGFVWIALDYFRLRTAVVEQVTRALGESIALGEVDLSVGEVLAFAVGIWAAVVLSRILSSAVEEDIAPRLKLGPGVPAAAALVLRYTVLAIGFLLAAAAAGIGMSQLALFAGALGVGVGFGLQNVVSNFVSGLLLIFERPVKVGDTVDIAGFRGTITAIGIRSSTVRAWTGADVIIPNSKLIESELVNWTHDDGSMRVDVPVGVAYGSDLRRVHGVLLQTARSLPGVLDMPQAAVQLIGFGDSSLDFRVQVWIAHPPDMPQVTTALTLAVNDALAQAGIEIPFPQRDLHIRSDATTKKSA